MGLQETALGRFKDPLPQGQGRGRKGRGVVLVCVPLTWKPVWSARPPEGEEGRPFKYREAAGSPQENGQDPQSHMLWVVCQIW